MALEAVETPYHFNLARREKHGQKGGDPLSGMNDAVKDLRVASISAVSMGNRPQCEDQVTVPSRR